MGQQQWWSRNFTLMLMRLTSRYGCIYQRDVLMGLAVCFVSDAKEASPLSHPDVDPVGASLAGGMRSMDTPLGAPVQLDCPCGQGSCWRRIDSSGSFFAADGPSLSFNSVLYQDAGKYQCGKPDLIARADRERWLAAFTVSLRVTGEFHTIVIIHLHQACYATSNC